MLQEFKKFALKGNVMDMAIGIIIGAAFSPIVKSLVADLVMPPIGMLVGNVDFTNLFAVVKEGAEVAGPYATLAAAKEAGAVTVNYGLFFNTIVSFLIVTFAVFMMVKVMNRWKKEEEEAPKPATEKDCPFCVSSIAIAATRCPNCTSQLEAA